MQTINKRLIPGAVLYFYKLCISAFSKEIYKQSFKSYIEIWKLPIFVFYKATYLLPQLGILQYGVLVTSYKLYIEYIPSTRPNMLIHSAMDLFDCNFATFSFSL